MVHARIRLAQVHALTVHACVRVGTCTFVGIAVGNALADVAARIRTAGVSDLAVRACVTGLATAEE